MKPKHKEIKNIDSWICCWCGTDVHDNTSFDLHYGEDSAECPHCGKTNRIYFSIEYTSQPEFDE
jgi:DNA-directed RNA polymerase subunit RPC12/RpoP